MSKLISKNTSVSQREVLEQKYNTSRLNLLVLVIATAVNMFLIMTNTDSYFLFSAFLPYYLTGFGWVACGYLPEDQYQPDQIYFIDSSFFVILLAISIVIVLLYLAAWFFSKKHRIGWIIFALVMFVIDTVCMIVIGGFAFESVLDILFHAWVLYYFFLGINANSKLKKLPPVEETVAELGSENIAEPTEDIKDSEIIRKADTEVKNRILLEARMLKYDICYRRVKHTNELVINGDVYAELEGIIEQQHTLQANIDGHLVEAEFDGAYSVIRFDGETIAKKIRLF